MRLRGGTTATYVTTYLNRRSGRPHDDDGGVDLAEDVVQVLGLGRRSEGRERSYDGRGARRTRVLLSGVGRVGRARREATRGLANLLRIFSTLTLLGAIDDATSEVRALHFRPTEDLHGYATILHEVCTSYGLPVLLYGDGINILVRNDAHWTLHEQLAGEQGPTRLGAVLKALGIGYVRASSPQAKGRVERLWATLQDRLVSELRLRRIATAEAANAFLPTFRADFNRRFTRPAAAPAGWRRVPPDFDWLIGCRYERVAARDNTVRLGSRIIDIPPGRGRRSFAHCRVEVRELLDGRAVVFYHGQLIAQQPSLDPAFVLRPRPGGAARAHDAPRPGGPARTRSITAALAELATVIPQRRRRHPWCASFSSRAPLPGSSTSRRA
jgi:hypothetical protein